MNDFVHDWGTIGAALFAALVAAVVGGWRATYGKLERRLCVLEINQASLPTLRAHENLSRRIDERFARVDVRLDEALRRRSGGGGLIHNLAAN
jgi:hypothetical protein